MYAHRSTESADRSDRPPPLFVSAIYCVGNGWWFLVVFVKSHLVTVTSVFVAL